MAETVGGRLGVKASGGIRTADDGPGDDRRRRHPAGVFGVTDHPRRAALASPGSCPTRYTPEQVRRAPKVLLHDHLDGGLRPGTVIELAAESGYDGLPTTDADELAAWFTTGAARGDLVLYLEGFAHTVASCRPLTPSSGWRPSAPRTSPMTASSTPRSASLPSSTSSSASPSMRSSRPPSPGSVGAARAARSPSALLLSAMRTAANSVEIAELALRHRDAGVVGFDIAGSESGSPPDPAPRRVPVHRRGQPPHHDPRRRGLRPAVDLGGGAALRRRTPRPRRADRRRHRPSPRRQGRARPPGQLRPRPPGPARDVPDVQRQHRRGPPPSPITRSTCSSGCGSGSRSTPTTGS